MTLVKSSLVHKLRLVSSFPDTGFPFVSRTGKTNDFTKIKGWRGKLHGASRNEGKKKKVSLRISNTRPFSSPSIGLEIW